MKPVRVDVKRLSDRKKEAGKKNRAAYVILVVLGLILGSGFMVYNVSELYMINKNTATISAPLMMMKENDNVFLVTTYDDSGRPKENVDVKVEVEYNGEKFKVFEGETDESGSVQPVFEVPDIGKEGDTVDLIVTAGSEKVKKKVVLDSRIKLFVSTDKPIYQPSQVIHLRALCFEGSIPLVGDGAVQIEIMDPDGDKIYREFFTPNDYGIVSLNYSLSDQLSMGTYKFIVTAGDSVAEKNVLVKRYVLPKIDIGFDGLKNWYTVNDLISGNITCKYFFGKEVVGDIEVQVNTYYGVWENLHTYTGKLTDGKYIFEIPPIRYTVGIPSNADNGLLELNVTVTDTGGHKETETRMISIARQPIILTLLADSNVKGTESNHHIIARYPDGMHVPAAQVKYYVDFYSRSNFNSGSNLVTTRTDDRGVASIDFAYNDQRYLGIQVTDFKSTIDETYNIQGTTGLKVIPDDTYYDVGEVASFDVYYTGTKATTKWVYYDVLSRGFVVNTGHIKLDSYDRGHFKLPITPEMSPLAEVRVYKTQTDLNVLRDIAIIGVGTAESGLTVDIQTDRELYLPADEIEFQFTVKDMDDPVQAAIGLAMVDQSVFEVHERFSGLEKVMQDLEEEFITPQYQICNYIYSPNSPVSSMPEETESIVDKQDISSSGKESLVLTSGTSHFDYSEDLEDYYVNTYWYFIIVLALVGLLALFILALKYRVYAVIALMIMISLPLVLGSVLYTWTMSLSSTEDDSINGGGTGMARQIDRGWDVDGDGVPDDNKDANPAPPPAMETQKDDDDGGGLDFDFDNDALFDDFERKTSDTNGDGYGDSDDDGGQTSITKSVQTRQYFPETWYWNPWLITDEKGQASLKLTTPDSITTWNVEAVATTRDARFGMGTANVTVFKGFFIEPDVPVSAVRNDEFPLKVLIYNYEDKSSNVTITLEEADWFELLSGSNVISKEVEDRSVASVEFRIRAKNVGTFQVTVSGDNGQKIDKVIRNFRVEPDGKPLGELVNGMLENDQSVDVSLQLYDDRVPDSENAYVKLQGGIEAVTLEGADRYIVFVSGCGEQSTSRLSLTIAAYKHLLKSDITDEKMFEYENIINQGIQHVMMYVDDTPDGIAKSIVWHQGEPPDMWLTAWGTFVFQDLVDTGFNIDEDIIPGFQSYLISTQSGDGSYVFPDEGHWSINNKLLNEKVTSTAYITRALLYSGYSAKSSEIKNSIKYIENNVKTDGDPYTLAISLLALEMGGGSQTLCNSLADALIALKNEDTEDGTIWWTYYNNEASAGDHRESNNNIESTSYAVMALDMNNRYSSVMDKAIKYLLTERNQGLYDTTHDTAVAFQALNTVGELKVDDLTVSVKVKSEEIASIRFTEDNKDITYYVDLRPYLANDGVALTLTSSGSGSIVYQVYSEQYMPWDKVDLYQPQEIQLDVKYDTTKIKVKDIITATVTMTYRGEMPFVKMILIDLRAPVGFSFIESEFADLFDKGMINNYEVRGRQACVYIDDVEKDKTVVFKYSLLANKPIRGTIQGIHAYNMYDAAMDTEIGPVVIESEQV